MLITASLSLFFVGWRQKWWLVALSVENETAIKAAGSLGVVFCIIWGFVFIAFPSFLGLSVFLLPEVIKPSLTSNNSRTIHKNEIEVNSLLQEYEALYRVKHGNESFERIGEEDKLNFIRTTRLHYGNAILGSEHFAILPLQISIAVGL